ncbi:hypothetical protein MMC09_001579 [Bachmanniomyces sp. S44760]|nr:hypothetical protein [Bachmanniomyces sp. S44760]
MSKLNANTPAKLKRRAVHHQKIKRKHTARLIASKRAKEIPQPDGTTIIKRKTPRTSQALRQAAPWSKKKARKMERKIGFESERKRKEEATIGASNDVEEVSMSDVEEEEEEEEEDHVTEESKNAENQQSEIMATDWETALTTPIAHSHKS